MFKIYQPVMRSWKTTAEPAVEPVSDAELNAHLNLTASDATADATQLARIKVNARAFVEDVLGRALIDQTVTLKMSEFPAASDQRFELPMGHTSAVTSITYTDASGASATLAADQYVLDSGDKFNPATIQLAPAARYWPDVHERGDVTVVYQAGYADADAVPEQLVAGVLMVAASLYHNRASEVPAGMQESIWFKSLLSLWRIRSFV